MLPETDPHGQPGTIILRPGMVSLDWLTLNMLAPDDTAVPLPWQQREPVRWEDPTRPEHLYVTQPTNIRTAQFASVTYLIDGMGEKVATIWSAPHNEAMHNRRWIQVQFSNPTLYCGEWVALFRMFRALGCEYTAIGRVDIACDGIEGHGGEWPAVVQLSDNGGAKYYGKCDWIRRNQRGTVIGAEFGSRASNKFIRAYRKKREMKAKGVKRHIVNAWIDAFGFDAWAAPVEVNRFEVSLKGKEIRRYFKQEGNAAFVESLENQRSRVDVFASMAVGMFDFRTNCERARDARPVCRWDWSGVQYVPQLQEREQRAVALSDHTLKTGLRSMFHVATVTGDPSGLAACERLAEASGLLDWYAAKRYHWLKEFAKLANAMDPRTRAILANLETGNNDQTPKPRA